MFVRVIGYLILHVQTQGTIVWLRCIDFCFSDYFSTHIGASVQLFHFPQFDGEGGAVFVTLLVEGEFVLYKALFECTLHSPMYIYFFSS